MRRRWPIVLGLLVGLLVAAGCGLPNEEALTPTIPRAEGDAAPTATAGTEEEEMTTPETSYAGTVPALEFPAGLDWLNTDRPLTLEQLRGRVVILDFWTYGCINCIHIIPDLKRLEAEYPDELVVIGVHSAKFDNEEQTENIRQVILRYGLEHPVVNDRDFRVWKSWDANAWPTLYIIDPAGNIVGKHSGEGVYPLFKPVVDSLVREFEARGELDRTPLNLKLEREGLPETVLSFPGKVLVDTDRGCLFIADTNHNRVVVAALDNGVVLDVIGSGEAALRDGDFGTAAFFHPQGMALSADGQVLYVADTENHALRRVDLEAEGVTTLVGTGEQSRAYPPRGGSIPDVALNSPWDLALDGETLYIAMAGTHQIWLLDLERGSIAPYAGSAREGTQDGPLPLAELAQPSGLALDGQGRLYFADSESSSIRWVDTDPASGQVGTLAGGGNSLFIFGDVDGVGREARLQHPLGVAFVEGVLYVADTYNSKIKRIDPATGLVETFLGSEHGWRDGNEPLFYEPGGIDAAEGKLYVADTNNHSIRVIDLSTGEASTLVLRGIERFAAAESNFFGRVVRLDPVDVAAGPGKLRLEVDVPGGYKLNDLAPHAVEWRVEGGVITLPADADRSLDSGDFPLELEVTFNQGEGQLTADLDLYYCEEGKESLCLIEQVRLEVPLRVGARGEQVLELTHRVDVP